MIQHITAYIKDINALYQTGLTTEHSFRPALQRLLSVCTGFTVINEQTHIDCGAPDLTLLHKNIPIAYIEAKDLEDGDLDGRKKNREQFDRYKASLDTIIFTDYLDFHLYEHGEWQQSVRLAEIQGNKIRLTNASSPDSLSALLEHIKTAQPQRITSANKLAQLMAGKARLLRDIIEQALIQDGDTPTELRGYMMAFQQVLIHDITPKTFADIYAQTIAYGMFAARMHDESPADFTREEAAHLIPKSNPFLRKVFQQIAGYDLDERIAWIVDDLVAAFAATDMQKIMEGFGKSTQQTDPILHFYEDFLYQYDPAAKKQCGVYYTPQPVVDFIVRAVDDILRTDFSLPMGLADTSKVTIEREIPQDLKHRKEKIQVHRVQVLDPATGTGTFLAETVRQIKRNLGGQMGAWHSYVPEHLLPRLHGFELMMAPYTIAHLKLDTEIGVAANQRLRVFLTNSLEEYNQEAGTLFGNYLAQEANEASAIKKDAPVMIVMGNPPYSISSNNKGEWISHLLDDYKKNLNERKINIEDDYIKFIRLAQHYVERNGEGILAYICNNSFIDGITHRQMRSELMRVFDKIYILDLHGNARKKETAPDGSKDENVFDIMQGVSINIFVKKKEKSNAPAEIFHYDLYGNRTHKYDYLQAHTIHNVDWTPLQPQAPSFFFVPKDFSQQNEYEKGFKIDELMKVCNSGIQTKRDNFVYQYSYPQIEKIINTFKNYTTEECRNHLSIGDDGVAWKVSWAKQDITSHSGEFTQVLYRPFDLRWTYYTGKSSGLMARPRTPEALHLLKNNLALLAVRNTRRDMCNNYFVSNTLVDKDGISSFDNCRFFPLYLYPEDGSFDTERRPNLDATIWAQINAAIGKPASPEDIFDYIYGVLHSPTYRTKYKEFLKVDFPRIPYPASAEEFEHFRSHGNRLRELHLMHAVPESPVTFPNPGTMQVDSLAWEYNKDDGYSGNIYINDTQCFEGVPTAAFEMYIGGYQPAQKWLKDRKGRTLTYDDIEHYRRIIAILIETDKIMKQIDNN